ncbi:MAG: IclR family transcriptional regulator [Desulfobacteraceae bacterium]|nr:IclR family transcriptional regulator [Desulfobacteraceae bacterium]
MKQNRTALRVVQIMDLLTEHEDGLTLSEIVKHLELPKTSVFDIVHTLKNIHMLRQDNKRFTIGFHAYKIGCAYIRTKDLYSVAKESLTQLAEEVQLSVSLILYEDGVLNYVFQYDPLKSYVQSRPVDLNGAMHASASGKVILANLDQQEREGLIENMELTKFTETTITEKAGLQEELKLTKARGYGIDNEEYTDHFFCISVPIFDHERVLAAVSFSGLKVFNNNRPQVIKKIMALGHKISAKISATTSA